ncbi:MAG: hypothetical protein Q4B03_07465 [Lachnospiraceae bacterium]|nr:hypothetical protein [Lachnospiraceae bacterium]
MIVKHAISNFRIQTAAMDRKEKASYIAEYYWYHILLSFAAVFVLIMVIYNFTFGRQTVSFQLAIVNEQTDDERDTRLSAVLAEKLGLEERAVVVDSKYSVSYEEHLQNDEMGSVDYSGYDKFFFGWSNGELDAVVLPSSLLEYCLDLGGELKTLTENGMVCIALKESSLVSFVEDDTEDPMVIILPLNGRHVEEADLFCELL